MIEKQKSKHLTRAIFAKAEVAVIAVMRPDLRDDRTGNNRRNGKDNGADNKERNKVRESHERFDFDEVDRRG